MQCRNSNSDHFSPITLTFDMRTKIIAKFLEFRAMCSWSGLQVLYFVNLSFLIHYNLPNTDCSHWCLAHFRMLNVLFFLFIPFSTLSVVTFAWNCCTILHYRSAKIWIHSNGNPCRILQHFSIEVNLSFRASAVQYRNMQRLSASVTRLLSFSSEHSTNWQIMVF